MSNDGLITANSTGPANAGNIEINAGQQLTLQDSSITTAASQATGGNITIQAANLVQLGNSTISASVQGGPQTSGGNITIDPNSVILQNSQIIANAVQGQGGNISITTNVFLPDSTSVVSASSQFGVSDNVAIQSPISQGAGQLSPLPKNPLINAALLSQRCAALGQADVSSFIVAGRDTLPVEPGGWLTSPLLALETVPTTPPVSSLADDTTILSLRRLPS